MEGHRGLPSATDVQGKSLPPASSPAPGPTGVISLACPQVWLLYFPRYPKISTPGLADPTPGK